MAIDDDMFDYTADVLVVGTGAAGQAAAVAAALAGASVIMFEWAETIGGTSAAGGATAWIPNNPSMHELHGIDDPRDQALQYLCRLAFPQQYHPTAPNLGLDRSAYQLIETFYDRGAEFMTAMRDAGALELISELHYPDYHADLPEDVAPRGRHVRPPSGTPSIIEQLDSFGAGIGIRTLTGHRVVDALRNGDGAVVGLELRIGRRGGFARARKGVVFGTGGFMHDPQLAREHLPGRVFGGCSVPTTAGDFVRIGQHVGASFAHMNKAWWKQVLVEEAVQRPDAGGSFLPFGDSMIQVNRHGRRVVNEKAPYNDRSQVHHHWDPTGREYPNLLLFMIWDEAVAQNDLKWPFRPPVPMPGERPPYLISGADWHELAAAIDERLSKLEHHTGGVRLAPDFVEHLVATVERFNQLAVEGVDRDFGRGESPIQIDWNGPGRPGSKNPTMAPLRETGPYHCVILGAGVLDTSGGPRINTSAEVLDAHGSPIPGLYGAGNCVAAVAGQAYWGPGATIGAALVYGYIAGSAVAAAAENVFDLG
jgi:succinate dehydrogenase/fumarate reductase flavoprotein subunit